MSSDMAVDYDRHFQTQPQLVTADQHTMAAEALDRYVETKFSNPQKKELRRAVQLRIPVEVHGLFGFQLDGLLAHLRLKVERETHRDSRPGKRFNNRRPSLFQCIDATGQRRLLSLVSPSKEYVAQHAELVEYFMAKCAKADARADGPYVTTFHYPDVESHFPRLTGFKAGLSNVVTPGDIVVIGEVDYLSQALQRYNFKPTSGDFQRFGIQHMYGWKLHVSDVTNRRLLLVGCNECYWGTAAARLARELADLGAKHIIYSAKCGTAHEANRIHTPVCPSEYYICEENRVAAGPLNYNIVKVKNAPPSSLRDHYVGLTSALASGIHLTVPTVMGETMKQQGEYGKISIGTIDNEISYIARELAEYNQLNKLRESPVEFTALHFVTDYVRRASDRKTTPEIDLGDKGRADESKQACFNLIAAVIDTYAYHEGQLNGDPAQYGIIEAIGNWSKLKDEINALGQGGRRVYWRRDFPKLLDGWVAAYYRDDLTRYKNFVERIASSCVLRGPNMESAVEWCLLACEFAALIASPPNEEGILRYENLIGIAQGNLDVLDHETLTQPSWNRPSKILRAIYGDLIGACLIRVAMYEPQKDERNKIADMAIDVLNTAMSLLRASTSPTSTRVIWQCWVERYLAIALHLRGRTSEAKKVAHDAALHFEEFLEENEVTQASFTGGFLYGELNLIRLKAIEIGGKRSGKAWHTQVKSYSYDEGPTIRKTVRQAYERIYGVPANGC